MIGRIDLKELQCFGESYFIGFADVSDCRSVVFFSVIMLFLCNDETGIFMTKNKNECTQFFHPCAEFFLHKIYRISV